MRVRYTLALAAVAVLFFLPGQGVSQTHPARPLETPQPDYPKKAKERGFAGIARFRAHVDETGRVRSVEVKSVPKEDVGFEKATEKGVKKWRFHPAVDNGKPFAATYVGTVRFRLGSDDEAIIEALLSKVSLGEDPDSGLIPKLEIRGELETDTSVLEKWLDTTFGASQRPRIVLETLKPSEGRANVDVSVEERAENDSINLSLSKRGGRWFVIWAGVEWDQDPVLVSKPPPPTYPKKASKSRTSGDVILEIVVLLDGSTEVIAVLASPSHTLLEASLENAARWRWEPATKKGRPVEAVGIITVRFEIGRTQR